LEQFAHGAAPPAGEFRRNSVVPLTRRAGFEINAAGLDMETKTRLGQARFGVHRRFAAAARHLRTTIHALLGAAGVVMAASVQHHQLQVGTSNIKFAKAVECQEII
jgi:hypothetical protein